MRGLCLDNSVALGEGGEGGGVCAFNTAIASVLCNKGFCFQTKYFNITFPRDYGIEMFY